MATALVLAGWVVVGATGCDAPGSTPNDTSDRATAPADADPEGGGPSDTTINTDAWVNHLVGCDAIGPAMCCDCDSDAWTPTRVPFGSCPEYCSPGHRPVLGYRTSCTGTDSGVTDATDN